MHPRPSSKTREAGTREFISRIQSLIGIQLPSGPELGQGHFSSKTCRWGPGGGEGGWVGCSCSNQSEKQDLHVMNRGVRLFEAIEKDRIYT